MSTTKPRSIPDAVARYIDAANRQDTPRAADCFAPDAVVRDERKDHAGREAIERWISHTSATFHPHLEVGDARLEGSHLNLKARVSGSFPGSPLELDYEFQLHADTIVQLTIR